LDYPGCIFNTGLKVDPALDPKSVDFKPMSEPDQKNYDDCESSLFRKPGTHFWSKDNAELQIGAPVSLQVVAKRWNDAIALGATQLIEEAMRG
jgi:amidase